MEKIPGQWRRRRQYQKWPTTGNDTQTRSGYSPSPYSAAIYCSHRNGPKHRREARGTCFRHDRVAPAEGASSHVPPSSQTTCPDRTTQAAAITVGPAAPTMDLAPVEKHLLHQDTRTTPVPTPPGSPQTICSDAASSCCSGHRSAPTSTP